MRSRRDVLRTGAGIATAGGLASLAGCSNVPVVGSYFEDGIDYTAWAYDPTELGLESMGVTYQHVASLLEEDEVPDKDEMRDEVTSNYSDALSADDVEAVISVGQSEILTGSFDGGEVVDETGLSEEGSYGDFELYADESGDEAVDVLVATDGDRLVRSAPSQHYEFDAREELELLIDTYNGDVDGYIDVNENFERLHSELGTGDFGFMSARTESATEDSADDPVDAWGIVVTVDGAETNGTYVLVHTSESDVDLDEVESDIEENLSDEAELGDVSQDGRVVTAEYSVPTEDF